MSVLAVVLVVAVAADRGWLKSDSSPTGRRQSITAPASALDKLARYRAAIAAESSIVSAYAAIAPVFAERTALVPTVRSGPITSQKVREALLEILPSSVELQDVIIGTPRPLGRGVYSATATIHARSADSAAIELALWSMGDAQQGMRWEEFDLIADSKALHVSLTGKLLVLVLEAAE